MTNEPGTDILGDHFNRPGGDLGKAHLTARTDYFHLKDQLTDDETAIMMRTREFCENVALPVMADYWDRAQFPFEVVEKLKDVGIVGDTMVGYGCTPMSPLAAGLVHLELNRCDASLGTFVGVHVGLAMKTIYMLGSQEQKDEWLPAMAKFDKIGAFALTEPNHGSDSVLLETSARREGDEWVINGEKKWIGNGTIADVIIVWARDEADGQVKGFLVEQGTPGYEATVIERKAAVRAVWQAYIKLTDVRIPAANHLSGANSFKDTAKVLSSTRQAVAWGSLGHAVAGYEIAMQYCQERTQFGKPLVSFQLVQDKLVRMLCDVVAMELYCLQLGRLVEAGELTDTIAAIAKLNNTRKARDVLAMGRELLGGNGILLDYHLMQHMVDIEALYTFEGTAEMQTLIVGRYVTGASAFV